MRDNGVEPTIDEHAGAIVHLACDGAYCGHIVVADKLKPGAGAAMAALRALGVSRTVMLTGDLKAVGDAVGREVGVDEVRAELMPAGKVEAVEALLAQDYPHYAVYVIDDRSTDATPAILAELAARDPRLTVIAAPPLPAGWAGKPHALAQGVQAAGAAADWYCFVDAVPYNATGKKQHYVMRDRVLGDLNDGRLQRP